MSSISQESEGPCPYCFCYEREVSVKDMAAALAAEFGKEIWGATFLWTWAEKHKNHGGATS